MSPERWRWKFFGYDVVLRYLYERRFRARSNRSWRTISTVPWASTAHSRALEAEETRRLGRLMIPISAAEFHPNRPMVSIPSQNGIFRRKAARANLHTSIQGETIAVTGVSHRADLFDGGTLPFVITNAPPCHGFRSWATNSRAVWKLGIGPSHHRGRFFNIAASVNYNFSETFHSGLRYDFIPG